MNFKIIFLFFLISIKASCQLDNLGKFYSEKLNNKNEDKSFAIYKIKDKVYTTDHKTFFSLGNKKIFENKTNDYIELKSYKNRYLLIGYYPKDEVKDTLPSSLPPLLIGLDIVDLEDSSKKWSYDLSRKIAMMNIQSFNPEDGLVTYNYYLRPKPKE